jgi:creatinine amidohydrolase/Fe(II)-dependent formamide hydrolase-like protein
MAGTVMFAGHPRFHRLDQITQLRGMDRDRTVVLLPVGMLEVNGGHLPLGTDSLIIDALTAAAAAWLLDTEPEMNILLLPLIPYGTDPVDLRRSELFAQAGGVWLNRETLKAIVGDICAHLIRYGFRHIFPLSFHGGADQCAALEEVCSDLRQSVPGLVMFEPGGHVLAGAEMESAPGLATMLGRPLTSQEEIALRGSIHAAMSETSIMLHLNPNLVDPSYRHLRSVEWRQMYDQADWPGYLGTGPAYADDQVGGALLRWRGVRAGMLIRRALAGEDLSLLPRHPVARAELEEDVENLIEPVDEPQNTSAVEADPAQFIDRVRWREKLNTLQQEADLASLANSDVTPRSDLNETRPTSSRVRDDETRPGISKESNS